MSKFIAHSHGWVNATEVVSITANRNGGSLIRVRDREASYDSHLDPDDLAAELDPIIPAAPGFVALHWYPPDPGKEPLVTRVTIIAWRVGGNRSYSVLPVLVDNSPWIPWLTGDAAAILDPSGRVFDWKADMNHDTEAEWMAHCQWAHERRAKETVNA